MYRVLKYKVWSVSLHDTHHKKYEIILKLQKITKILKYN